MCLRFVFNFLTQSKFYADQQRRNQKVFEVGDFENFTDLLLKKQIKEIFQIFMNSELKNALLASTLYISYNRKISIFEQSSDYCRTKNNLE